MAAWSVLPQLAFTPSCLGVGVKTQGRNPQTENGESQEGAVTSFTFGAWPILFGRVRPKRPRRN